MERAIIANIGIAIAKTKKHERLMQAIRTIITELYVASCTEGMDIYCSHLY